MSLLSLLTLAASLHGAADTTLVYGTKLPAGKALPLATVAAAPKDFLGKTIVVEGVITTVCQEQGCWMEFAHDTAKGTLPARVDFKHKFLIPMNSAGMQAKIIGTVAIKTYSKEEADHLIAEGSALKRQTDGTATGIEFVATGAELRGKLGTPVAKPIEKTEMKKMGGGGED